MFPAEGVAGAGGAGARVVVQTSHSHVFPVSCTVPLPLVAGPCGIFLCRGKFCANSSSVLTFDYRYILVCLFIEDYNSLRCYCYSFACDVLPHFKFSLS